MEGTLLKVPAQSSSPFLFTLLSPHVKVGVCILLQLFVIPFLTELLTTRLYQESVDAPNPDINLTGYRARVIGYSIFPTRVFLTRHVPVRLVGCTLRPFGSHRRGNWNKRLRSLLPRRATGTRKPHSGRGPRATPTKAHPLKAPVFCAAYRLQPFPLLSSSCSCCQLPYFTQHARLLLRSVLTLGKEEQLCHQSPHPLALWGYIFLPLESTTLHCDPQLFVRDLQHPCDSHNVTKFFIFIFLRS